METRWSCSSNGEGQNSYLTNTTWDTWDISTPPSTPYDWRLHSVLFDPNSIHHRVPDQHVMCLNLGKRYYCEDAVVPAPQGQVTAESSAATKRGKALYPSRNNYYYVTDTDMVPRCQVEGCYVALGDAKEYYRKHKVCEMHSKAPKVVVLGLQQRFCQQCSRFHRVTEFDEAKRSCRRRLKGHNQRRRKVTLSNTIPDQQLRPLPPSPSSSQPRRAFSLLSSPETLPWNISNDLSSRCSTALYELIAANRATSVFGHLLSQNMVSDNTLADVKQGPALEFGDLSMKGPLKRSSGSVTAEEWTDYGWS